MVVHGENSLNDGTEDEGTKPTSPMSQAGPTLEQLIATGEIDPEDLNLDEEIEEMTMKLPVSEVVEIDPEDLPFPPEDGEESDIEDVLDEESEEPGAEVITPGDADLSVRKQVEMKLAAGATREELIAEGYNKNTVRTVASEMKTKSGSRKPVGKAVAKTASGMPAYAKGAPPELIIDAVKIPDLSDGQGAPFESGMKFGLSIAVLGIRMAQELSGIGVQQAKPLIDMAKSMREGEAVAAKTAAEDAAAETAALVQSNLSPLLASLAKNAPVSTSGDPMKDMMSRVMEPVMTRVMSGMIGGLLPGGAVSTEDSNPRLPGPGVSGWRVRDE